MDVGDVTFETTLDLAQELASLTKRVQELERDRDYQKIIDMEANERS